MMYQHLPETLDPFMKAVIPNSQVRYLVKRQDMMRRVLARNGVTKWQEEHYKKVRPEVDTYGEVPGLEVDGPLGERFRKVPAWIDAMGKAFEEALRITTKKDGTFDLEDCIAIATCGPEAVAKAKRLSGSKEYEKYCKYLPKPDKELIDHTLANIK
jgi:hypothetical protein